MAAGTCWPGRDVAAGNLLAGTERGGGHLLPAAASYLVESQS